MDGWREGPTVGQVEESITLLSSLMRLVINAMNTALWDETMKLIRSEHLIYDLGSINYNLVDFMQYYQT